MSLKEIAAMAGTSVATVSRVLNNKDHRCNDPGLEKRIWDAARQLQYVPNETARMLRKGDNSSVDSPFTVDILLTRFDSIEEDAFFEELFQCIKEELIQNGCVLGDILHNVDITRLTAVKNDSLHIPFRQTLSTSEQASSLNISVKNNTGLIILGKCPSMFIPSLRSRYSYIAGIDRNPTDYEYDEVICNGQTAASKAMEYLITLGHKNIAYIGDCTYEARYIGYYQTLLLHNLPLNHINVHPTNQTVQEGFAAMVSILDSNERPTAIFCANDSTALGVLNALKKHKKKGYLPSVIAIDNIAESQKTSPMLTTIDIPKKEMGHLALMLLLDRKAGSHTEHVRLELPCRLIERESCSYLYE